MKNPFLSSGMLPYSMELLTSSSEMSATSNLELLKAHAIISRSWLLAQTDKSKTIAASGKNYKSIVETPEEYIRWYDREDHQNFDVCADDHCQRYQGITRQSTPLVEQAIAETRGMLIMHDGKICDARFSKSCGGISETFENVWEENGVLIRFQGVVSTKDIIASNEALYKDIRFDTLMQYQIADFIGCKEIELVADEVREIARRDAEMSKRKPGVLVAIVTDMQLIYGFSRMYQMCTDHSTWETGIFENMETARKWIEQNTPGTKNS